MLSSASKFAGIVAVVYLVLFFALGSGLINAIIEVGRGARSIIIPSRSVQTIGETIVTTMILIMGTTGVFLLYRSGKAISPKSQQGLLTAGFAILGISLALGFMLVNIKI